MADYDRKTDEWDLDRGLPKRRPNQGARQYSGSASRSYTGEALQTGKRVGDVYDSRMTDARKKRRKKKQRIKRVILTILLIILLLLLVGIAAYIMMQHLPQSDGKSETYQREIDITDSVCGDMALWLSDIDGQDIDVSWVKSRCPKLVLVSNLSTRKGEKGNVKFEESIDSSSYDSLNTDIYSYLDKMLSEAIADNLVKSGYAETVSSQEAANIATQILGMEISEYIKENGVNVLPTIEELNARYTLGNGGYRISGGIISINPADGNPYSEKVIKKKDSFVLVDSARVYVKKEGENE